MSYLGDIHNLKVWQQPFFKHIQTTERFRPAWMQPLAGYYSSLGDVCACIDGVGTKLLLAQMAEKYDTVGIDCVAMNVNDLLCVGAKPFLFLDYIALAQPNTEMLTAIGAGLAEGARQAQVWICGGETAVVPDMVKGIDSGKAFDLVGVALGTPIVPHIADGSLIEPGDAIIGILSNGFHSNGYTVLRELLFEKHQYKLTDKVPNTELTIAQVLLAPTYIYVKAVLELFTRVHVHAAFHITGDGFKNLLRTPREDIEFLLHRYPCPSSPFEWVKDLGAFTYQEMFEMFNMGIGFCVICPVKEVQMALRILLNEQFPSYHLGSVQQASRKSIQIQPYNAIFT